MFDILTLIPGKRKLTHNGWYSFNAVCCSQRGHRPDRRGRGGIKFEGPHKWTYHCFNCNYSCVFTLGRSLNNKTRQLLKWLGVDEDQIQRWSLESLQNKDLLDLIQPIKHKKISFKEHKLPENSVPIDINNPRHEKYVAYLKKRGMTPDSYPFLVTPNMPSRYGNRIIIPYTHKNKIVGCTSRFLDDKTPKYINEQQPGYVFGMALQKSEWQVCIVVEGVFDALSIDGCAVLHDDISSEQASLLASLNKRIIVVPDQDKTGMTIVDRALELGYSVSIPEWDDNIKDVNDAVVKYGKLQTLLSILECATNSKIKLELRKKQIGKDK